MKTLLTRILIPIFCGLIAIAAVAEEKLPDTQVCILGDSMMKSVARAYEKQAARTDGVTAKSFSSIGSGLARLDLLDWHAKVSAAVAEQHPDVVVVLMGANDNQPMKANGLVLPFGTPEWETEYAARATKAIDIMITGGVERIFWIGLPDMRDQSLQRDVQQINTIFQKVAQSRPQVEYLETQTVFSKTPGEFSPYIIQATGMPLPVRSGDGTHLNHKGAKLLADIIMKKVQNK